MDDQAKIAALCEALKCACPHVEVGPRMGHAAYLSLMNRAEFLLKTYEEQDEVVPVTDEESIDF